MSALPADLAANPRLDLWARVDADGFITVRSGKVELGQGITTAIVAIAARQLCVSPDRIRIISGDTALAPDEGQTAGSQSIEQGGAAMRVATALVRGLFATAAARALGAAAAEITVEDGWFFVPGRNDRRSYWDLANEVDLARDVGSLEPAAILPGTIAPPPRLDLPAKLAGTGFIHDLDLPGMRHGRIIRPAMRGAHLDGFDRAAIEALPGVLAVLRDGDVVGIVAERDDTARAAAKRAGELLRWRSPAALPPMTELHDWMDDLPANSRVIFDETADGPAAFRYQGVFARPYIAHAAIGPACAVARWSEGTLEIWSHSQGVFPLRSHLARALGMAESDITVTHRPGAGCYGHNGADDVALDAALLARAAGAPVMCQWSRADELSAAPSGAAMRVAVAAELDANGKIISWDQEVFSPPHFARPSAAAGNALLSAWSMATPQPPTTAQQAAFPPGTGERNGLPLYVVGARRLRHHLLPQGPLRSSALRSLGAHCNVFAIESVMDELALHAGIDPVRFRLMHLDDPRARAVIEAAATMADWREDAPGGEGVGRGIGFARYKNSSAWCAVVAEVELGERVRLTRAHIAVDCGEAIDVDGVVNQIEGGAIQAASWTLIEEAGWDSNGPRARAWEDYPVLRFGDTPDIRVRLLQPAGAPPLGAGECVAGPMAGALGNAVRHALGVRVRRMPLTPERIATAIEQEGS